ncbi:RNA 2',3'-cyclic phosphodiesterase [Nanoarchaeota archaeon]
MRLFIAIEVPEDIKQILIAARDKLIFPGKAAKTKEFHLTLKFLGEVDEPKAKQLSKALEKIEFNPFTLTLSDIGAFPNRNKARVIWAGLTPHENINSIQQRIDNECETLGFKKDDRFHPHLTLARIKSIDDKEEFLKCLDSISLTKAEFKVDSFKLIKSTLTPEGPIYDVLNSFSSQQ